MKKQNLLGQNQNSQSFYIPPAQDESTDKRALGTMYAGHSQSSCHIGRKPVFVAYNQISEKTDTPPIPECTFVSQQQTQNHRHACRFGREPYHVRGPAFVGKCGIF